MPERKSDKELLADLLARGYGEDEKRKRRERAAASTRRGAMLREKRSRVTGEGPELRRRAGQDPESPPAAQRMEDVLGPLPPQLRRRIDRYAWRGGYLATGIGERVRSLMTVVAPKLEDFASRALVRQLVGQPGGDPTDPAGCSLLDALVMLNAAARLLLGGERPGALRRPDQSRAGERIASSLRVREPFLVPLLNRLAEADPMAIRALEFARIAYSRGDRVRTWSLVRAVRCVYRLALATDKLEADVIARLAAVAAEINRAQEVDAAGRRRVEIAASALRVLTGRMRDFRHELFPLLLKCLGVFFPEESLWNREHFDLVCAFVDLKPEDVLDYGRQAQGGRRPEAFALPGAIAAGLAAEAAEAGVEAGTEAGVEAGVEGTPRAPAEGNAPEAEQAVEEAEAVAEAATDEAIEAPAAADDAFAVRFKGVLDSLRELFPESGIHRLQQYHFVLPYFDLRVFTKDLRFPPAAQLLARSDPMTQVMVLHRILDNLISSVNPAALSDVTSAGIAYREGFGDLVRRWKEVYTSLFDPYLKQIEDYSRAVEADSRSQTVRRMEDTLNRMRNHAIRHFGHIIAGVGRLDLAVMPLYSLAEQLAAECRQLADLLNPRLVAEKDRTALAMLQAIADRNVVDLEVNSYKPTIERLKRLLERRFGRPLESGRMHLAFFEILYDLAALYDWLLNDKASFYRTPPDGPLHAGPEEHRRWASTREALARGGAAARPLPVSASAESWALEFGARFETLRRAGRLTFVIAEVTGRDVLEAEGEPGALALAAAAVPARGSEAPVAAGAIGRDRLLLVTVRGSRAAVGWVDLWRSQVLEALRKHPVYSDVLEQRRSTGLGSLIAGVADVGDCGRPLEALARAQSVLAAARSGVGPIAVWHHGEIIGIDDYLSRVVARG